MKKVAFASRLLLGLLFTIFGFNGFLHFIPMPPPEGLAGQFMGALFASKYLVAIFVLQILGGGLLLANRFVPLALAILAPIVVNIVLFHALMAPQGLGLAFLTVALWAVVFTAERDAFKALFAVKTIRA
jgi:putative oxidoreductase